MPQYRTSKNRKHKKKYEQFTDKQQELLYLAYDMNDEIRTAGYNFRTVDSLVERGFLRRTDAGVIITAAGLKIVKQRKKRQLRVKKLERDFDSAWGKYGKQNIRIFADEGKNREPVKILGDERRFDFVFPDYQVAIEIQGGTYSGGAHVRGKRYDDDCNKNNEALQIGWIVIALTATHLRKRVQRKTINQVIDILESRGRYAYVELLLASNEAHMNAGYIDLRKSYNSVATVYSTSPLFMPAMQRILDTWQYSHDQNDESVYKRFYPGGVEQLARQRREFAKRYNMTLQLNIDNI